jgi:hypothetical protein
MALERCYSLRKAAKILGVSRTSLRKMLLTELALVLPELRHGQRNMIRESVLERLMERRGPKTVLMLLRSPTQRRAQQSQERNRREH